MSLFLLEPRKTSESSAFTDQDVLKYKKYVNKKSLVIHRINECDERKNTNYVNKYLIQANKVANETIFVSEWLKKLFINQGINSKINHVVYAGANSEIFNPNGFIPWDGKSKLKIVTHHWEQTGIKVSISIQNLMRCFHFQIIKIKLNLTILATYQKIFLLEIQIIYYLCRDMN